VTLDWNHFTPFASLCGGALIGLASGGLVLLCGRVAGISGIVGGLLCSRRPELGWRVLFIAGLSAAPWLWGAAATWPEVRIDTGWPLLVFAGLLVGFGTRLGSGCTSGHGVCGLSRLSPRSCLAVLCFMGSGFGTVFITRHILGL